MNATSVRCPRCLKVHDAAGRLPGQSFLCGCGAVLAVPLPLPFSGGRPYSPPPPSQGKTGLSVGWVLGILGALVLVCSGALAAIAIPNLARQQQRTRSHEARSHLQLLCSNERAYHEQTGAWLAAGPLPKDIPRKVSVPFPADPSFDKLGFAPEQTRYQYQVHVRSSARGAPRVSCIARGDLNGDGVASTFEQPLDEKGQLLPLKVENEAE